MRHSFIHLLNDSVQNLMKCILYEIIAQAIDFIHIIKGAKSWLKIKSHDLYLIQTKHEILAEFANKIDYRAFSTMPMRT